MKQNIARQYSHHRDRTPSALRLPPPKPPSVAKRPVTLDATLALPETPEPLVLETTDRPAPPLSRQARRRAMRAEAKALRREGHPPAPGTRAPRPGAKPVVSPESAAATVAKVETDTASDQPLPKSRALVAGKPRGIVLFVQALRAIFSVRQAYVAPVAPKPPPIALAGQLRALRSELAALQQSLDRMIEGVTA